MTKYEIEHKITRYKNYIDSNNYEIKKLHNQLDELSYTRDKLNSSQNRFSDYLTAQRQTYQRMQNNYHNNRFAANFSAGMLGCLGGTQASRAHENISASIQKVKNKINNIENKVRELNSENRRYQNIIEDLKYDLRRLK